MVEKDDAGPAREATEGADLDYGARLFGASAAEFTSALEALTDSAQALPGAVAQLGYTEAKVWFKAMQRCFGASPPPEVEPLPGDRRFADRAWSENPMLRAVAESYLAGARTARQLVKAGGGTPEARRKRAFVTELLLDAAAPTNLPFLNPSVMKQAIETGGLSLVRGAGNFVEDVVRNGGQPRQVDASPLHVGEQLAATPGRVVMRNDLVELLAYEPQTKNVHEVPILASPPWINKYYIMDLAPGRSFLEFAVQNRFTVFCLSYRDPDRAMSRLGMDDYLSDGLLAGLERVEQVTGARQTALFGLCLGGTLLGILLGYLAAQGEADRIAWAATTNTLLDFGDPGKLGVFTDESSISALEKVMEKKGFLPASMMRGTFDWLRSTDLIWNSVINNWYEGKQPAVFDILAWNADSTNLPARMHSQYLRSCYLENRLVEPGAFEILSTPIDLSKITTPLYVLGAEADHIAPWRSTYRTTQLVSGEARYALTSSGHIAGIVNPPGNPKARYWSRPDCPPDADDWRAGAEAHQGSWWEDWLAWASERSGKLVTPPELPPGPKAPGRYVVSPADD
jgi:polyhydroxyalkanoate synthase